MNGLLVIAAVLAQGMASNQPHEAAFPVNAADFPAGTIVTVDDRLLSALDDAQLRALLQFAGSCGRVLLVDVSTATLNVFRSTAACGGRYLAGATSDELALRSAELGAMPDPPRATDSELLGLLRATAAKHDGLSRLALFWIGFLLITTILLCNRRSSVAGLGFALLAAILVPAAWPNATQNDLVAWSEVTGDDRVAAYHSVARQYSRQHGRFESLLTRGRGNFDRLPKLAFAADDTTLTICNTGPGTQAAGHVSWHGKVYALSPLASGETWRSDAHPPLAAGELREQPLGLFTRRSRGQPLTVLHPLPAAGAGSHAWLLQYASPVQDRSPCNA